MSYTTNQAFGLSGVINAALKLKEKLQIEEDTLGLLIERFNDGAHCHELAFSGWTPEEIAERLRKSKILLSTTRDQIIKTVSKLEVEIKELKDEGHCIVTYYDDGGEETCEIETTEFYDEANQDLEFYNKILELTR